jgi:dihydropyrimidine dehydrogenase (NAD+) subunit PreA
MPVSLINTINSIVGVDLDRMIPSPHTDGKATHGGMCGPAVKPIALNMVAEIARSPATRGLPMSGIGGIETWRDAAEYMALGCGTVQVCTAAMVYGFKIVQEMITGLEAFMDERGYARLSDFVGAAVPNVTDWQYLNLNYAVKARIDQDLCIKCGRCHVACEDTSHQAITHLVNGVRHFEVIDEECVGCNLCASICPIENCITMEPLVNELDRRTGRWWTAPTSTGPSTPTIPRRRPRNLLNPSSLRSEMQDGARFPAPFPYADRYGGSCRHVHLKRPAVRPPAAARRRGGCWTAWLGCSRRSRPPRGPCP